MILTHLSHFSFKTPPTETGRVSFRKPAQSPLKHGFQTGGASHQSAQYRGRPRGSIRVNPGRRPRSISSDFYFTNEGYNKLICLLLQKGKLT